MRRSEQASRLSAMAAAAIELEALCLTEAELLENNYPTGAPAPGHTSAPALRAGAPREKFVAVDCEMVCKSLPCNSPPSLAMKYRPKA